MKKVNFEELLNDAVLAEYLESLSLDYEVELLQIENSDMFYFNDLQDSSNNTEMTLYDFAKWFYDDIEWKVECGLIDSWLGIEEYSKLKEFLGK